VTWPVFFTRVLSDEDRQFIASALRFYQCAMEGRQVEGGCHAAEAARLEERFDAPMPPAGAR
jgi:hypothetical protein